MGNYSFLSFDPGSGTPEVEKKSRITLPGMEYMILISVKRYIRQNLAAARFFLFFVLFFVLGETAYHFLDPFISPILVNLLTVKVSAALINLLSPAESAIMQGTVISSANSSILIAKGCEGVDGLIIVLSAIGAYPGTFRHKASGFLFGTLIIYGFNILRIIVLFHASKQSGAWFDFLHLYAGQTFIIIIGVAFFLIWSGYGDRQNE